MYSGIPKMIFFFINKPLHKKTVEQIFTAKNPEECQITKWEKLLANHLELELLE